MSFFANLAILFYVVIISVLSGVALFFVTRTIMLQEVTFYLEKVYYDDQLRAIVGLTSCGLIFLSLGLAKMILGSRQKEKTIAFDNPSGRVSIALTAVEDLVRRIMYKVPEVKEIKPHIFATKRGLEIEARLILRADVNIQEMTSQLQDLVKNKIQDIIGIDEKVIVRIHIVKIVLEDGKTKSKKEKEEKDQKTELAVPFQGYRN